jgi:hypothetical protein
MDREKLKDVLEELDRRIRGTSERERNVIEQMESDQRNADRMGALIDKISRGIKPVV